jgi:hypothetical protein
MRSLPRFLNRAGEAISKHHELAGRLAVSQRLEHDVVAALREWCAVP